MDFFYSTSKEAICPWELCLVESLTHRICRKRSFKFSLKGKSPIWQFWVPYPLIHSPHSWCNYHSKASLIMWLICLKLCDGRIQMSYFGGLGHPSAGSASCFLEVHVGALRHLNHLLLTITSQPALPTYDVWSLSSQSNWTLLSLYPHLCQHHWHVKQLSKVYLHVISLPFHTPSFYYLCVVLF